MPIKAYSNGKATLYLELVSNHLGTIHVLTLEEENGKKHGLYTMLSKYEDYYNIEKSQVLVEERAQTLYVGQPINREEKCYLKNVFQRKKLHSDEDVKKSYDELSTRTDSYKSIFGLHDADLMDIIDRTAQETEDIGLDDHVKKVQNYLKIEHEELENIYDYIKELEKSFPVEFSNFIVNELQRAGTKRDIYTLKLFREELYPAYVEYLEGISGIINSITGTILLYDSVLRDMEHGKWVQAEAIGTLFNDQYLWRHNNEVLLEEFCSSVSKIESCLKLFLTQSPSGEEFKQLNVEDYGNLVACMTEIKQYKDFHKVLKNTHSYVDCSGEEQQDIVMEYLNRQITKYKCFVSNKHNFAGISGRIKNQSEYEDVDGVFMDEEKLYRLAKSYMDKVSVPSAKEVLEATTKFNEIFDEAFGLASCLKLELMSAKLDYNDQLVRNAQCFALEYNMNYFRWKVEQYANILRESAYSCPDYPIFNVNWKEYYMRYTEDFMETQK